MCFAQIAGPGSFDLSSKWVASVCLPNVLALRKFHCCGVASTRDKQIFSVLIQRFFRESAGHMEKCTVRLPSSVMEQFLDKESLEKYKM